jgi:hypothetical protein
MIILFLDACREDQQSKKGQAGGRFMSGSRYGNVKNLEFLSPNHV